MLSESYSYRAIRDIKNTRLQCHATVTTTITTTTTTRRSTKSRTHKFKPRGHPVHHWDFHDGPSRRRKYSVVPRGSRIHHHHHRQSKSWFARIVVIEITIIITIIPRTKQRVTPKPATTTAQVTLVPFGGCHYPRMQRIYYRESKSRKLCVEKWFRPKL